MSTTITGNSVSVPANTQNAKTYCQIATRGVSAQSCRSTQGQEACFGCASKYRLCEKCKERLVDVAAVGQCSTCLAESLREETREKPLPLQPRTRVPCQLTNSEIRVAMCKATQGQEGCRNCSAPSRYCESCHDLPVRFPRYGMCLACSVKEFGEGWQPVEIPQARGREEEWHTVRNEATGRLGLAKTIVVPRPPDRSGKGSGIKPPASSERGGIAEVSQSPTGGDTPERTQAQTNLERSRMLVQERGRASCQLLARNLKIPFREADSILEELQKEGIIGPRGPWGVRDIIPERRPNDDTSPEDRVLLGQARELVITHRRTSAAFLQDKLEIAPPKAHALLSRLEAEGVVGPTVVRGQARQVLLGSAEKNGGPQGFPSCREPGCTEPVYIKKYGLCARHSSRFYERRRRASTTISPEVKCLLPQAKAAIRKHGRVTRQIIQEELGVGLPRAKQIIKELEREGLVSTQTRNHRRAILNPPDQSVPSPVKDVNLDNKGSRPLNEHGIQRIERLIRSIGENTDMGKSLRSLIDEVRSSRAFRKHLRNVVDIG